MNKTINKLNNFNKIYVAFVGISIGLSSVYADEHEQCVSLVTPRLTVKDKALAFNSLRLKAWGFFVDDGVPAGAADLLLNAGGPPGSRTGASNSVVGAYIPYRRKLRKRVIGPPPGGRFVSVGSLEQQIEWGEKQLQDLLTEEPDDPKEDGIPADQRTFVESTTVATNNENGFAWGGINFRLAPDIPGASVETFKMRAHFRLTDKEVADQKDVVKYVMLNMLYGAYGILARLADEENPEVRDQIMAEFIKHMGDFYGNGRVEFDLFQFTGSIFHGFTPMKLGHWVIGEGLTEHLLFSPEGEMVPAFEKLYGEPIVAYSTLEEGLFHEVDIARDEVATESGKTIQQVRVIETLPLEQLKRGQFKEDRFYGERRSDWHLITRGASHKQINQFLDPLNTGVTVVVTAADESNPPHTEETTELKGRRKAPLRTKFVAADK